MGLFGTLSLHGAGKSVEQGVRFRAVGRHESCFHPPRNTGFAQPRKAWPPLEKLVLTVALSYGGRAEIVDAVKALVRDVQAGTIQARANR